MHDQEKLIDFCYWNLATASYLHDVRNESYPFADDTKLFARVFTAMTGVNCNQI